MPISRALGRIADFWASRKVTLRFTADFRIASFSLPLIKRLLADTADGETYRCSIAEWPLNERPPLHVHRGVVAALRVDGPLQAAGKTYLPLGGLIETPFVTAHLDPVETQRLDRQVQEAIEQTIADWICEHRLYDRPRARREIDRAKADPEARAVIDRWVAEQSSKPEAGNTSGLRASNSHDCCPAKPRAACAAPAGNGSVMAENIAQVAMLEGHDAAHRTRNLDTHLTHECIQLFRHFSGRRSDSTFVRLAKNGELLPFSETAGRCRGGDRR